MLLHLFDFFSVTVSVLDRLPFAWLFCCEVWGGEYGLLPGKCCMTLWHYISGNLQQCLLAFTVPEVLLGRMYYPFPEVVS